MIRNITNLQQLKELVERYEAIKFIEIYNITKKHDIRFAIKTLTKIAENCQLCAYANKGIGNRHYDCPGCIYYEIGIRDPYHFSCVSITYRNIWEATTVKQLFHAYRNRAKYIRKLLINNNLENNIDLNFNMIRHLKLEQKIYNYIKEHESDNIDDESIITTFSRYKVPRLLQSLIDLRKAKCIQRSYIGNYFKYTIIKSIIK